MDLSNYKPQWVELSRINFENKTFQFRKQISEESVRDLADSMSNDGQKFPVILWLRNPSAGSGQAGELQPVSGYRRITAAKSMGWEKVLSIIVPEDVFSETEALRLNFIENIERKTLNNLDIMFACKKLKEQGKSNVDIGRLIGKSENQVRRYLKVADASADIQARVQAGETTINDVADGLSRRDGEVHNKNKNNYVKSTRKVFEEKLKIEPISENTPIFEAHIEEARKAWKQAVKQSTKKQGKAKAAKVIMPDIMNLSEAEVKQIQDMQMNVLKAMSGQSANSSQPEIAGAVLGAEQIKASIAQMKTMLDVPSIPETEKQKIRDGIAQAEQMLADLLR